MVIPGSRDIVSCGDILKRRFIAEALESTIISDKQPSVFVATDLEVSANARLIAAAPELLEACDIALHVFERIDKQTPWSETEPDWWLDMVARMEVVRAAIAKAEGSDLQ
jgi:hypothetical protein